jgi:hypothetical protein
MGHAKNEYMRMLDDGRSSVGHKFVCSNCIEDYALKDFIEENAIEGHGCDYCQGSYEGLTSIDSDTLLDFIGEGLRTEYEDPVNSVGWCSAEGGWLLPTTDLYDLFEDLGLGKFCEDAAQAFSGHEWVERDPYGDRPWEQQLSRWAQFCDYVKHHQRFFFHSDDTGPPSESLVDILDYIGKVAIEARMVRTLDAGSILYRARQHSEDLTITTTSIAELATPPANLAVASNRMSPAGIPIFYAARDPETAFLETATADATRPVVSIGKFETTAELRVLDLGEIPPIPSLFDESERHLRAGLKFMHAFADDLAEPIKRDGREHIDYVPTQIVSEFFRLRFCVPGGPIDGICFKCSKHINGICVCLFFKNRDFVGDCPKAPFRLLEVQSREAS